MNSAKQPSSVISRKLRYLREVKQETDFLKQFSDNLQGLQEKDSSVVQENMTAEDFANADVAVIATSSLPTDEEIWKELQKLITMNLKISIKTKNWLHEVQEKS